ncbi:hypothetical protein BH09ACT6_BH09ACT6_11820 [soil metagenome]
MKVLTGSIAALAVADALAVGCASSAQANSANVGSQVCGFGGPAAASTAHINGTSIHRHQANGVA